MAKKEKGVKDKPKRTVKIVYRIFAMTDEGHLREPKQGSWGGNEYVFDHYSGYESIVDAAADIERHDNTQKHAYGKEYVILPMASTQ